MRYHAVGSGSTVRTPMGGRIVSVADETASFCYGYVSVASSMFDPATLRIEPVFWGRDDGRPDPTHATRIHRDMDEEPHLFRELSRHLGRRLGENDRVVMIRDSMLSMDPEYRNMFPVVVQDAASILTDETPAPDELGWTGKHLVRAAIGAILTIGAAQDPETTHEAVPDVRSALEDLKAVAFKGIVRDFSRDREDGVSNIESIIIQEYPGLATCLDEVVDACLELRPPSLPMDMHEVCCIASDLVEKCASRASYLRPIPRVMLPLS